MAAQPEADHDFRKRIIRAAEEADHPEIRVAQKHDLDVIGRRCGRFRYGVPLPDTKKSGA